ncbi:Aminolevulinate dehydratase, partial [Thelotrema lepadinum]|nr:Aminolevulinate dehydratase [Thelotrema lepadinum]
SLPSQHSRSVSKVLPHLEPLIQKGLQAVGLFGVMLKEGAKNPTGTGADDENGSVIRTIKLLRSKASSLLAIAGVCLCEYTSHGYCGNLHEDGSLINTASIDHLSDVTLAYA